MLFFDMSLAVKYGVDEAIMLQNFIFWIQKNKANKRNFFEGKYWTYNSVEALGELFPCWTKDQIRRILKSLEDQGLLIKGSLSNNHFDRTSYYTITHDSLLELPKPRENSGKRFGENPKSTCVKPQISFGENPKSDLVKTPNQLTYNNQIEKTDVKNSNFSSKPVDWKKETFDEIVKNSGLSKMSVVAKNHKL